MRALWIGLGVASILTAAAPAYATRYILTYTGTTVAGHHEGIDMDQFVATRDDLGLFVAPGDNVVNLPVTAVFDFDSAYIDQVINHPQNPILLGDAPFSKLTLTVNGVTLPFVCARGVLSILGYPGGGTSSQYYNGNTGASFWGWSGAALPIDFSTPYTYSPSSYSEGYFVKGYFNPQTNLTVAVDSVSFAIQAVPEIETWTMMVLGFGATGALARQRRRLVPA